MRALGFAGVGLAAVCLQLTVVPLIAIFGVKPNVPLLTVALMGLVWLEPWLFIYAALAGLALDVFSHGILGVYGLSFFVVSFAARSAGVSIFENNLLFVLAGVFALSLAEGLVSVTLLQLLDPSVPWLRWMAQDVLPAALYNALLAPLLLPGLGRLERRLRTVEH